jgi:hypothetical protein
MDLFRAGRRYREMVPAGFRRDSIWQCVNFVIEILRVKDFTAAVEKTKLIVQGAYF